MLVNISSAKRIQMNNVNSRTNGSIMSYSGISAAISGIFVSNFSYGSPAFVSVTSP